jgi:phosphatidylglycerophosphatase A
MVRTLLISCGGLGFLRPAPGTWGSIPPAAVAWLLLVFGVSGPALNATLLAILAISCVICITLGEWAEQRFGRKDASQIVIDETAGQCIPLLFWPTLFLSTSLSQMDRMIHVTIAVSAAFVLFRIFDIIKPWPAHGLQKLPHGWGVLVDDLFAGLYAAIVMQIGLRLIP